MFQEHNFSVWGTNCPCGHACGILQNGHHPWGNTAFTVKLNCPACGREVVIDQKHASNFYSQKILSFFRGLSGTVLDLGCGGGFLSRYLVRQDKIRRVVGVDPDPGCSKELADLKSAKFEFRRGSGCDLAGLFPENSFDFLVSRDVFLFLNNPEKYFQAVSHIVKKGIRQMSWYQTGNPRMKNNLQPKQICETYQKYGWIVEERNLDWYPYGYFISASRKK